MKPDFGVSGKVVVITGGGGAICGSMSKMFAEEGAKVAVLDLRLEAAQKVVDEITAEGGEALALSCNVLDKPSIEAAAKEIVDKWGTVDILVNGAGGNKPQATTGKDMTFFEIPPDAIQWVFNLNLVSAVLSSQVFGKIMADKGEGSILNISSMNAFRPLTKIIAYSAAKAAINNFTQWLAVYMAKEYSPKIRVNAIAPGFFIGNQNHDLLIDRASGNLTDRGKSIISLTPMNRFGEFDELLGATLFLVSPAAQFITGVIIPIDGGFSSFSGV